MATIIKLKRSETASSVPTTSDLAVGEVALNTVDRKIYVRDSSNNIIEVANASSAGTVSELNNNSFTFSLDTNGVLSLPTTGYVYDDTVTLTTTTSNQTLDSFNITSYRGAKYVIQATSGADVHATELLLVHDDSTVYTTVINTLYSSSSLISLSTVITSGVLYVRVTPTYADTIIDFIRTSLTSREIGLQGDLMILSGSVDLQTFSGSQDLNA